MKDGDFVEFGTIPNYNKGQGPKLHEAAQDFLQTMEASSSLREYMHDNPTHWLLHGRSFLNNYYSSAEEIDRPYISVCWIYGPTGAGKSFFANEFMPKAYRKAPNHKWWHRYRLEKDVIIDEVNHDVIDISHWLIWFDRYKCSVETKGGEIPLHADRFIVTSNYHPDDIFTKNQAALKRRISIFYVDGNRDFSEIKTFFALNDTIRNHTDSPEESFRDIDTDSATTEIIDLEFIEPSLNLANS